MAVPERPRRTFAIERTMQRQAMNQALGLPTTEGTADDPSSQAALPSPLIAELLKEVKALRQEIKGMKGVERNSVAAFGDADEAQLLRIEIARMIRSLAAAKREIAEIKHPLADEDRVQRATSELDAIVGATERATHLILDAAETINEHAERMLKVLGEEDELAPQLHAISNEVFVIIEACNFQDITGQRITRVVKTLEFIEERVKKIIADWGAEAFADLPLPKLDTIHTSDDLVDGPQLESEALSQDDIDSLFG
ncbi:hypothetical protein CKO38_03000 [Rhodospirillum rubrum]|uniref:protein phosphatase CheZ n=1 Tax=Rhodospirillum rubrum TaxID=1085 RepID=UPI0019069599|nr:protein phosphatase CheZ [Rhodospirillum rubrum]MBK1663540.1 hypothetical protein [Rhodospirillum rubrum]MBK1675659.1 hypothetical protein [Rhodospirillum rubrum]